MNVANNEGKRLKAIIYCRVSTKEQAEEGLSLQNQEKACIDYANNKGFDRDKIFIEEGESAKTQFRTQLLELLSYCKENAGKIDALIVWKLDRFSRQTSDHFALKATLAKYGVRIYSVTEPIDNSPQGQLMETVLAGFAQFDNDIRSERSKIGMRDRLNEGRWVWKAPIGYVNSKDALGNPTIIADEVNSKIITQLFEDFSKGVYTQVAIWQMATKRGLKRKNGKPLSKQTISKILTNQIYAGYIYNPWTTELIKGVHRPLVDEKVFYKCQAILKGKTPSVAPRLRNNPTFPLRGFVKCGSCGKPLTGSKPRGRTKSYEYYHCYHCKGQKNVQKKQMEKDFIKLLAKVKPSKKYIKTFQMVVLDTYKAKYAELNSARFTAEKELAVLENNKRRLVTKFASGDIGKAEYEIALDDIKNEITIKNIAINETIIEEYNVEGILNYGEEFMEDVPKLWKDVDIDQQQRFQQLIFPEGLTYGSDGFIVGTFVLSPVYAIIGTSNGKKSTMVVPRGVEPLLPG